MQALAKSNFGLAERCAWECGDLSGLLLLYTSLGDSKGLAKLATRVGRPLSCPTPALPPFSRRHAWGLSCVQATEQGKANVGFTAYFLLGKMEECIELLLKVRKGPSLLLLLSPPRPHVLVLLCVLPRRTGSPRPPSWRGPTCRRKCRASCSSGRTTWPR